MRPHHPTNCPPPGGIGVSGSRHNTWFLRSWVPSPKWHPSRFSHFCRAQVWIQDRDVRKTRKFFSKYADHVIAKYAAKICGNRPRLHICINLTWYIFWRGGVAQSLFRKFTAYQSLESTCIGLIGRKVNLQQQIVGVIVRHVHLTMNIDSVSYTHLTLPTNREV